MKSRRTLLLPAITVVLAASLAAWGYGLMDRSPYRAPGVNVVFLSVDTLRADHLGCYGYERDTSPNLDAFAAENIVFRNHFVNMTFTLPSHTSMFTGLHPRSHGILKNGLKLNPDLVTLPEILKENGYRTAGFVSAYPLSAETRFDQGFDHYEDVDKWVKGPATLKRVRAWLDGRDDSKPFFLFVHFWDPHGRYNPPARYRLWGLGKANMYDGEIRFVDDVIGDLLRDLRERGLYDETLVVFTSDHGESLGERDFWGHGMSLYDNCLHAPLVIHLPASLGVPAGEVTRLSSTVDLMPTLLSVLRIDHDQAVDGLDIFGGKIGRRDFVFAQRRYVVGQDATEMRQVDPSEHFEYGDKFAARSLRWKYILRTRYDDELYDLESDPQETENLLSRGGGKSEQAVAFADRIDEWIEETPPRVQVDLHVDDEVKERLRALGYVN